MAVGGFAAKRRAGRKYRPITAGAGAQQQMRVASRREPTEEAQHRVVLKIGSNLPKL